MALSSIVFVIIFAAVVMAVVGIVFTLIKKMREKDRDSPWIIKGIWDAKQKKIVKQDPKITNAITLRRSDNERGGIEFTYALWFLVDDWNYQYGYWKHMFHKGSSTGYPDRCPGVLLHKTTNAIRIYLNTYKKINEYIDIEDIPIGPWVHLVVVVKGMSVDIYINGRITKSRKLTSHPRQNYGDLYVCDYKGFSGQVANMRYYNRAISYNEIDNLVSAGPGNKSCIDTNNIPPYLNSKWWNKRHQPTKELKKHSQQLAKEQHLKDSGSN